MNRLSDSLLTSKFIPKIPNFDDLGDLNSHCYTYNREIWRAEADIGYAASGQVTQESVEGFASLVTC